VTGDEDAEAVAGAEGPGRSGSVRTARERCQLPVGDRRSARHGSQGIREGQNGFIGPSLERPVTAGDVSAALAALAFGVFFALFAITALIFAWAGRERALALGFMTSQRNMGLMLAATGGALPDLTWLYFALSQFPICLSPQVLKPLVRRLQRDPKSS